MECTTDEEGQELRKQLDRKAAEVDFYKDQLADMEKALEAATADLAAAHEQQQKKAAEAEAIARDLQQARAELAAAQQGLHSAIAEKEEVIRGLQARGGLTSILSLHFKRQRACCMPFMRHARSLVIRLRCMQLWPAHHQPL
jgi:phosphoenolpyruvate carboxylase